MVEVLERTVVVFGKDVTGIFCNNFDSGGMIVSEAKKVVNNVLVDYLKNAIGEDRAGGHFYICLSKLNY